MSPENIINRSLKSFPRIIDQVLNKKIPVTSSPTFSEENPSMTSVARSVSEAEMESLERLRHFVFTERHNII